MSSHAHAGLRRPSCRPPFPRPRARPAPLPVLPSLLLLLLLPPLLAAGPAGPPAAARAGQEATVDGVPHVRNGAAPPGGRQTWRAEELWRAGGEDDEVFFGQITQVLADAGGRIHVLDSQLCQVSVYDADGRLLRTLFRKGEGPGEVTQPRDMLLLPDGRVALAEEFPGRLTLVERDGTPAGRVMLEGEARFVSATACAAGGGQLLVTGTHHGEFDGRAVPRTNFASRYSLEGRELTRLAENLTTYDFSDFVFREREHMPPFWWTTCAGPDGRIYVTPDRDRYLIRVHRPDGSLERVIEREGRGWTRDEAEKRLYHGCIEGALAGMNVPYRIEVEDRAPAVASLHRGLRPRPDGSLWVLGSRGMHDLPPGILAVYDEFDARGHLAREVALAAPGDPLMDGIFPLGDDRLVVVQGYLDATAAQFGRARILDDDEAEPEPAGLICYRLIAP